MSSVEISMDTIMEDEDSVVSNTDAIIYAASDISGWTHSLISDNNIPNSSSSMSVDEHHHNHHHQQISTAAGGGGNEDDSMIVSSSASSCWLNNNKQIDDQQETRILNVDFRALCDNTLKSCGGSEFRGSSVNEESSVRLVNTMMACAEAIQENNLSLADELISDIRRIAVSQIGGAMKKEATYFADALHHKIHRTNSEDLVESSYSKDQVLSMSFYDSCLFLKFAHLIANQSILEAFANSKRVHVIDFSLNQGSQWPALLQALTLRPGGPPAFRLTGIGGHSQPDDTTDALQEVGGKLAQLAESMGIEFEFRGLVVHTLADLEAPMLNIRLSNVESVAVNSVFKLHRVFSIPGAIEKVMDLIKQIDPKIVTIAEREVNHNESVFMNRIKEAWHYYSTMFDLLENSEWTKCSTIDLEIAAQHLGREIYNLVACEGTKRVMRHETFGQWRVRFNSAGFNLVPLGSNTSRHANMLLALYTNGKRYRVEEKDGCLMLSWNSRPLITTSAWRGYFAKSKD
ncbi:hypothetical protein MTR67_045374 [Solanum verrucosum]|uniref:DELLA protein n=1 Tax=Solanum verrucosum TaxID=315347 RepID=A0AAF0UV54_SOLVR|nr:hypothetical protein MTR67_045374 [Solanum verrucosum]